MNRHLEFTDITDFTPGYFDAGEWLMPLNGSQEMKDCRPDVGGGLRAASKPASFSTSGLPSGFKVMGIYTHSMGTQSSGSVASDRYIAVQDGSNTKIYRWNDTLTSAPTSWTLISTHASSGGNPVLFDTFVDASDQTHVLWTVAQSTTTDNGLWSLQFSYQAGQGSSAIDDNGNTATRSVTRRYNGFVTAVGVQDDRIIVADNGFHAYTLYWSDSQSVSSFPGANTLKVQASRQGNGICSIVPFAPSDLFIGTAHSAWTMIQNGVADPVVRTMSNEHTMGHPQRCPQTPGGLAFVALRDGIYVTANGDNFTNLSKQIHPNTWQESSNNGAIGAGMVSFGENLLLAPQGLVFDFRTESWHRQSLLCGSGKAYHSWYDSFNKQFFVAAGGADPALYTIDVYEATKWNTYTWKSASLRRPDNRRIRIREVQVVLKSYDASATCVVTVNGTAVSRTLPTTGRQTQSFLFDEINEVLDVQVVPAAASSSVEAPSIEAVRIGTQSFQQAY